MMTLLDKLWPHLPIPARVVVHWFFRRHYRVGLRIYAAYPIVGWIIFHRAMPRSLSWWLLDHLTREVELTHG